MNLPDIARRWVNPRIKKSGVQKTAEHVEAADPQVVVATMRPVLVCLLGLYHLYYFAHWASRGEGAYGDHQLFERLYKSVQGEFDSVAERLVGHAGEGALDGVFTLAAAKNAYWMQGSGNDALHAALGGEAELQSVLHAAYRQLDAGAGLTLGLDELIMGLASTHETNAYLLKQRAQPQVKAAALAAAPPRRTSEHDLGAVVPPLAGNLAGGVVGTAGGLAAMGHVTQHTEGQNTLPGGVVEHPHLKDMVAEARSRGVDIREKPSVPHAESGIWRHILSEKDYDTHVRGSVEAALGGQGPHYRPTTSGGFTGQVVVPKGAHDAVLAHELGHASNWLMPDKLRGAWMAAYGHGPGVGGLASLGGALYGGLSSASTPEERAEKMRAGRTATLIGAGLQVPRLLEEARASGRALLEARKFGRAGEYARILGPAFGSYVGAALPALGTAVGMQYAYRRAADRAAAQQAEPKVAGVPRSPTIGAAIGGLVR